MKRLTTLNIFIAHLEKHNLLFLKTLRNTSNFEWTFKCQNIFKGLKIYLSSPKVLSYPKEYKNLSLNLDVEDLAVNVVLVKKENIIQWMVYYFSNIFQDAETRYLKVEKKAFALANAFRKLKSYFLAHQIIILIDKPLWHILYKPNI